MFLFLANIFDLCGTSSSSRLILKVLAMCMSAVLQEGTANKTSTGFCRPFDLHDWFCYRIAASISICVIYTIAKPTMQIEGTMEHGSLIVCSTREFIESLQFIVAVCPSEIVPAGKRRSQAAARTGTKISPFKGHD